MQVIFLGRKEQEEAEAFFKDTGFWESMTSLSTITVEELSSKSPFVKIKDL